MFDLEINYINVLKEINPHVYEMINSIRNFHEELRPGKIIGLYDWGLTYNLQVIFNFYFELSVILYLLLTFIILFIGN